MEPDHSSITEVYARIEERRMELYKNLANMAPPPPQDEFSSFGQTIGFMAKNLPKDRQRAIMHQVYTLMHDNQPENVPTYCNL